MKILELMTMENAKTPEVKSIPLKSYTKKELRAIYDVPLRTFNQWIKPHAAEYGIGNGKYLTVRQVRMIFEKFGVPGEMLIL